MAIVQHSIAIGVFPGDVQARHAIDELRRMGFSDDRIGFLARVRTVGMENQVAADAAGGMVGGGIIGGVLGAAASLLIPGLGPVIAGGILIVTLGGAALGAAAGGLVGALMGLGVSEKEARFYQQELKAGHTVITVRTTSAQGRDDVLAVLRKHGAYHTTTEESMINTMPPITP